MLRTPDQAELPFATLALLSKDGDGSINKEKVKEIIKVFRPERDGKLSKLEFVKSIDKVYKEIRLLNANIRNSSQVDKAVTKLINWVFYFILGCLILSQLGFDASQLFLSVSSVVLTFSFMFGASASRCFEVCLNRTFANV